MRWALVATTDGLPVVESASSQGSEPRITLGALLDDVDADAPCWSSMEYLKSKEARDLAEGKGFAMQLVDANSTSVPTIRKAYNKGGSTDPYVRHPSDARLMRKLTPAEHARIKGVPETLISGMSATAAHEVLGQGVVCAPFRALFQELAECFKRLRDHGPVWIGECASAIRLTGTIG